MNGSVETGKGRVLPLVDVCTICVWGCSAPPFISRRGGGCKGLVLSGLGGGGTNFSLQSSPALNIGRKTSHHYYYYYNCVRYKPWTLIFKPKDLIHGQWENVTARELFSG